MIGAPKEDENIDLINWVVKSFNSYRSLRMMRMETNVKKNVNLIAVLVITNTHNLLLGN